MLIGIIIFIVYNLILLYMGWNGWVWFGQILPDHHFVRYIFVAVLIVLAYSFFLNFWVRESITIKIISAVWFMVLYILVLWLPIMNLGVLITRFTSLSQHLVIVWAGWTTLFVFVIVACIGMFNAYSPVVRNYDITIDKPVTGKQDMKVIMVSDTHFGVLSNESHARRMVKMINELKPDLVLFPGDVIDDNLPYFVKTNIPQILKGIEAPVYTSLGNHDRFEKGINLIQVLDDSDLNILYDESTVLDNGITLVGRQDYSDRPRAELAKLLESVDHSKPIIVMDHQPYELDAEQKLGTDLVVSGHTHRGQVAPAYLITKRIYENDWGYLQKGQLHSIVSSGYGFWGTPMRIGTRSEIVEINISFQPQSES
ncbi:metallophosphoesterase [Paenibacillus kyungheensis]|uniref:Metallophosphoesterase n=1 Tax=Paenibacillus kyungheensis TaxID=1452732 RepID=A0AAX3M1R9_9BACL|nr:metallophosphoesterase [Paenibacillus kyungheensis]WCT55792.1 metallophosphoesterase [Paenibacillus kyungheensis]